MMKNYKFKVVFIIVCLLFYSLFLFSDILNEDYYSPENILRFAEHLYMEKDYLRAAGEYQRYLFYFDKLPQMADRIFYKTGLCYQSGREYEKSINYFQKIILNYPESAYLNDSYYEIAFSYFLLNDYKSSVSFSDASLTIIRPGPLKLKIRQLTGVNYIYQKEWGKASSHFNSLKDNSNDDPLTDLLGDFAKEGKQLPRKSKFLAGLMSAIVPGTGKIYAKRTADGLISLFTIGLTGLQAYYGFRKDGIKSVKGWIYGSISAFFYVGNIFGSVVAVKIYNKRLENKFFEKVGVTVNVRF